MTPESRTIMLDKIYASQEMATVKQLYVINKLALSQLKTFTLPITKYEACLLIDELMTEENDDE